jgi:acyl-CoA thioesterase-2
LIIIRARRERTRKRRIAVRGSAVEAVAGLKSMGDLAADTSVEPLADGRWAARLSEDWDIWGPNGGYVASVCLRAAGAACGLARPATIACHYLAVGRFDPVELQVDLLRTTRRTAAVRVHMRQGGTALAEATVWAVAEGLDGYVWDEAEPPAAPGPRDTPSIEDRLRGQSAPRRSPFSFARNLQQKPITWRTEEEWAVFPGGSHEARTWMRFVPKSTFDDLWVDACRSLILLDTWAWPAAVGGVPASERDRFMAPNLDVTARFHADTSASEWLLVDARAPVASGGLIGTEVAVWTEQGALAASGGAQLLCRPRPPVNTG